MSRRNRRQFLEDSMLATAAAVASSATYPLFAEDNQSSSPNEKLGVAVIGVRGRGNSHIGAFAGRKDTEILYACDVDSDVGNGRAAEIAKRQGGRTPQVVADLRQVLEDKRVDIVSIATPNHLHALQAIWAIQAGKDVYVEKPVSHNVSEGRRVVEAARKYKRICQTGTQSRSNPGMIEAIEFVRSGKLGKVNVARGLCYKRRPSIGPKGEYPVPSNINYDLWLGPAPMAPVTRQQFHYDWHWQWAYGNGDLGNQGIHQMDLCRWGLGVDTLSDAVISYGGRFGYEDAGESANTQVIMHKYGDQALVFEVRGLETRPYEVRELAAKYDKESKASVGVIFECQDGYLVMGSYHSGVAFDKKGEKIQEFTGGSDDLHFANFLKAVRSRKLKELNADIEEGHLSSALCHLGNISYRLGEEVAADQVLIRAEEFKSADDVKATLERTVAHLADNKVDLAKTKVRMGTALTINPKTETFVDHPQADSMLTREYRKPFVVPAAGQV